MIAVSSTVDQSLHTARPFAGALAVAQGWAEEWLHAKSRGDAPGELRWNHWSVTARNPNTGLPQIVAHGDHTGVVWSALDHGWVD